MTDKNVNTLLRRELAATEVYLQAMRAVPDKVANKLRGLRDDHRAAANSLREFAHHEGVKPTRRSGVFGMFAKAVESAATFLGDRATLRGLRMAETYGMRSYRRALRKDYCTPECETLIRTTLLPQTRSHIDILNRLLHEV